MMQLLDGIRGLMERERSHFLSGHQVDRQDAGTVLREVTRIGAGLAFLGSRAGSRSDRDPLTTPVPPGRPHDGYGSAENYISDHATEHAVGSASEGSRVWWFVPDQLLNGDSAPVVVYLHGFRASAPDLYWEHIHHLTRQGYIVVFPRINKGGALGLVSDNDQPGMISRTIQATRLALDRLGDTAELDQVFLFGHSLGGLITACWNGYNGPPAAGIVMAHPSTSLDQIPEFARRFITPAEWRTLAVATTAPTIILGGDTDTLVPVAECIDLAETLKSAESVVVFITHRDDHGAPPIPSGHLATVRADSPAIRWLGHLLGGNEGDDCLHSRFYYAALDALLDGKPRPEFDLGRWSDGTPVAAPTTEFESSRSSGPKAPKRS